MRHILTAAVTGIEAMAIAVASLAVIVLPAVLLSLVTFSLNVDVAVVVQSVAGVWALGHGVPMSFSLDAVTAFGLGLAADDLSWIVSLVPLAFGLLTAALAVNLTRRVATTPRIGAVTIAVATIAFAVAATAIVTVAGSLVAPERWVAVLIATCWFAIPAWLTYLVQHREWLTHGWFLLRARVDELSGIRVGWTLEQLIPRACKLALFILMALVALASVAFFFAIIFGYTEVMRLSQALQLDLVGIIVLSIAQFAYLPTLIAWSLAWLSGAGFSIGTGSAITPFETLLGPVPNLPIFGAIPGAWNDWGLLAPVITIAAIAIVSWVVAGLPEFRRPAVWRTTLAGIIAVLIVSAVALAIAWLASGSMGPGRLATAGIDLWPFVTAIAIEVTIGVALGFALRFSTLLRRVRGASRADGLVELSVPTAQQTAGVAADGMSGADEAQTAVILPKHERIADPADDAKRPWFHEAFRGTLRRIAPGTQSHRDAEAKDDAAAPDAGSDEPVTTELIATNPAELGLSEEELLREYSWDARPNDKPESTDDSRRVD